MIDEKKLIEDIKDNAKRILSRVFGEVTSEFIDDFLKEMKELVNDQPKVGEWIPCSERLPETDENRKYLACGEKGGIYIAEFVCKNINGTPLGMSWWSARGRYCPNPIAWMSLPEPYKDGNKE